MKVFIVTEFCDGDYNILNVYQDLQKAKDRGSEIAEYADLYSDDDMSWSDDNGTCITITEFDVE